MNAERLERLKKRYGWDEWGVPAERKETPLLAARVDDGLLPGWTLQRTDPVTGEPGEGLPNGIRTMWMRDESAVLSVEIWQCASPTAAREHLLQVLEQFESPRVERGQGAAAVGEIAFAHGEQTLLFARENLVVLVRNAGARIVPVLDAARALDDGLRQHLQ